MAGHLYALLTVCLWGGAFTAIKRALREFDPVTLTWWRFAIGGIPFWILAWRRRSVLIQLSVRGRLELVAASALIVPGYHLLLNFGQRHLPAAVTPMVLATMPLWTMLAERLIWGERATMRQVSGSCVALAGLAFALRPWAPGVELDPEWRRGFALVTGALVCWTAAALISRRLLAGRPSGSISGPVFGLGCLMVLPLGLSRPAALVAARSAVAWLAVIYLALIAFAVANYCYFVALQRLGPTRTAVYNNLIPAVGFVAAHSFLGEPIPLRWVVGVAVILAGITTVQRGGDRKRRAS